MTTKTKTLEQMADRGLPHNAEAELALLGSLLLDSTYCDVVVIGADDFFSEARRTLFTHIMAIHDTGVRVDVALVRDRLKRFGDYESVVGADVLAKALTSAPVACHAAYYANIVRGLARQRLCIQEALDHALAVQKARDVGELDAELDRHEQVLANLDDAATSAVDVPAASIKQTAINIVERSRSDRPAGGLFTGLPNLDAILGGLSPKQVITIAARPGCGKTSFGEHLALVAAEQSAGVLFCSLEMSAVELHLRALANRTQVNAFRAQQGMLSGLEQDRMLDAGAELDVLPITIDDRPSQTLEQISRCADAFNGKASSAYS